MAGTLAELKTKQFFRANYAPSTGIGRFDAECSPARGTITIEDRPEGGARVRVRLPRADVRA
jgi:signal transduction histidine kinase